MSKFDGDPEGLWELLTREHDRLDQLFEQLLNALQADARQDALRLWAAFDDGLCQHMELEEEILLPALQEQRPEEAAALAKEHAEIRTKLADLGVALDLHETRSDVVGDFVAQLRSHAQRENELAYQWAEQHLGADDRKELRRRTETARRVRQQLCDLGKLVKPRSATLG